MYSFSVTYTCKYQISFANNYKFSICGKCYNSKTQRMIKQIIKGGSIGYVINGKFYTLTNLRKELEKIPREEKLPF